MTAAERQEAIQEVTNLKRNRKHPMTSNSNLPVSRDNSSRFVYVLFLTLSLHHNALLSLPLHFSCTLLFIRCLLEAVLQQHGFRKTGSNIVFVWSTTTLEDIQYFFKDTSLVLWNGIAVKGLEQIHNLFNTAVPTSNHDTQVVDCQPLSALGPTPGEASLLVTVSGDVTYGPKRLQYAFHHSFILEKDPSKADQGNFYFIVSQTCRSHPVKRHFGVVRPGGGVFGGGRGGSNSARGRGR